MRGPLSLKMGLQPSQVDARTLQVSTYLDRPQLPKAPRVVDWGSAVRRRPMYANDRAGTCVLASILNYVAQVLAAVHGDMKPVTDNEVVGLYSRLTGYNPADGSNDNGLQIIDVLKLWRRDGIFGHRIAGFMQANPEDLGEVQSCHYVFGGVLGAYAMPRSAETQFRLGQKWQTLGFPWGAARPGSWGYHAMTTTAADLDGWGLATWGEVQRASPGWMETYLAEAWVVLDPEWIATSGESPSGFNYDQLAADLAEV